MNIMELAIDQKKASDGVKVFYDEDQTCGIVVAQYMSAAHRASLAKHKARYQKELEVYEKKGDAENVEKISRLVLAHSMVDTVVLDVFGFEAPGPDGKITPVGNDKDTIFRLLTMPEFEAFYAWAVKVSNDTETFTVTDPSTWEEIGKKLLGSSVTK